MGSVVKRGFNRWRLGLSLVLVILTTACGSCDKGRKSSGGEPAEETNQDPKDIRDEIVGEKVPTIQPDGVSTVNTDDAAALSGTYGSVSAVTYVTALTYLSTSNQNFDDFMSAVLVVMEFPAIFMALYFVTRKSAINKNNIEIKDISTEDGDLEDVFVQLTKH